MQLAVGSEAFSSRPDIVVSGINAGGNLGDDVLYSGTVAAAMEARFLGVPSFAISLVGSKHGDDEYNHYSTAAEVAKRLLVQVMSHPLPATTVLNVNVPDVPISEIEGFEVTRLGSRHQSERRIRSHDPRGKEIYWIGLSGVPADAGPERILTLCVGAVFRLRRFRWILRTTKFLTRWWSGYCVWIFALSALIVLTSGCAAEQAPPEVVSAWKRLQLPLLGIGFKREKRFIPLLFGTILMPKR